MIPTYEDQSRFLKALDSVLRQDPGMDRMQIAIVDDASKTCDIEKIVSSSLHSRDRIEIYRNDRNLGLAGNWNRAISLARGEPV